MKKFHLKMMLILALFSSLGASAQLTTTADFSWVTNCNTVIFTDLSTTTLPDPIDFWIWDFGDGNYSSDQNPINVYADTGWYRVWMCVGNTTSPVFDSACISYDVYVPSCDDYNKINGLAYWDNDGDGSFSTAAGDLGWPDMLVKAEPGPYYGIADAAGNYTISVPAGTYTVEIIEPTGLTTTEPVSPYSFTFPALMGVEDDVDFGLTPTSPIQDLSVTASTLWPPVPGFDNDVLISYANEGNLFMTGSVSYTHDPEYTFLYSIPAHDSYTGGVISWNFSNLFPATADNIVVWFSVPTTTLAGDTLVSCAQIDPISGDVNPANNTSCVYEEVLASFDPNDKLVTPAGTGEEGNIPLTTEWLNYTIRFQNTGTFMATNVVLVDTIDHDKLDMSTFQVMGASHPYEVNIEDQGTVVWSFDGINLPDSSTDLAGSQGFISFRVKPGSIYPGLEINNFADIYFDFNAPIRTNTTRSTFSVVAGLSAPLPVTQLDVYPNPATDLLMVETGSFLGADFCLMGMDGRTYSCTQANDAILQLDISDLAAGSYILQTNNKLGFGEAMIEIVK